MTDGNDRSLQSGDGLEVQVARLIADACDDAIATSILDDEGCAAAILALVARETPDCGHPNHGAADHDCRPFVSTTVERAVVCANGTIHYAHEYLEHDDPERVREVADKQADASWCGGAPHAVKQRERSITGWHEVAS